MLLRIIKFNVFFIALLCSAKLYGANLSGELPRATLASSNLVESYSGRRGANVSSGAALVGLVWGKSPKLPNFTDVMLFAPNTAKKSRICVKVVTRDGLFLSDNPFDAPSTRNTEILAGPIVKKHITELKKYSKENILVRAIVPNSGNCSNLNGSKVLIPAIGEKDGFLRVYLLTHDRAASARISNKRDPENYLDTVRCVRPPPGSLIAVDRLCSLQITDNLDVGNEYKLEVRVKGRLGTEDHAYNIYFPRIR